MYYKGTKGECEDYNTKVTLGENYQGSTNSWANVISFTSPLSAFIVHN